MLFEIVVDVILAVAAIMCIVLSALFYNIEEETVGMYFFIAALFFFGMEFT